MVAYYRKLRYGLHHIRIATTTSLESFDPNESLNFWCVGRRGCCLHDVSRARRPTEEDTGSDPVHERASHPSWHYFRLAPLAPANCGKPAGSVLYRPPHSPSGTACCRKRSLVLVPSGIPSKRLPRYECSRPA